MAKCTQCDKQAIALWGGHPLCVEHLTMMQNSFDKQNEAYERTINMLEGQIWDTVGLARPTPPFPERKPPIYVQDKRTQNTIHIDRSVVGAVNTGTIENLEVSMTHINNSNAELAQAIKNFTESIGREPGLNNEQKQEISDQLAVLVREIGLPKEKRRPGVIKALAGAIKSAVDTYGALHGLWQIIQGIIRML